jgi:OFA family oxalate/formate antiporter-like MFS transporter
LFIAGYTVACFSAGHFAALLLGISCLGGAGIGFGYVCPLSVGMRWFPRHKGLITGVAVAGFGGGAVILSSVASFFLGHGMDVLDFFGWVALVAGIVLFLAAMLLAVPGDPAATRARSEQPTDGMRSPPFLLCALGIFAGTFAGLLIIGNLTEIAVGNSLALRVAVQGVAAFAVGNAIGRITWGYLFDRIHYRAIPASLTSLAAGLMLLAVSRHAVLFLPVSVLLGFGFGANFVVYAAALTRYFGVDSFAKLYPVCFLGYGVAGITGPALGGYLADTTGSYIPALVLSIVLLVMATAVTWLGQGAFTRPTHTPARETGM